MIFMRINTILAVAFCFTAFALQATAQQKSMKVYKDQTVTDFFKRTSGWIASDGGLTVHLSDNRTLWLMGDSHIDDYDPATKTIPCLFQVRNAALLQPGNNWDWKQTKTLVGTSAGIKSLFKHTPDNNYWFWPGAGVQIKDTVYVYNSELTKTGPGTMGFAGTGKDMWAKMKFPGMEVVGYSTLPDFDGINFGCGFVKDDKTDYVYAFGGKLEPATAGSNVYVARFPERDANAPWEFWNGSAWIKDVKQVKTIATAAISPNVVRVKNKYVILSTALSVACDQGKDIFASVGDSPTGPFTNIGSIYTNDDTLQGHHPFFYTVVGHPQFINKKNELLVTYCINGYAPCLDPCDGKMGNRIDPNHYRLKAIRVPLELLDIK